VRQIEVEQDETRDDSIGLRTALDGGGQKVDGSLAIVDDVQTDIQAAGSQCTGKEVDVVRVIFHEKYRAIPLQAVRLSSIQN